MVNLRRFEEKMDKRGENERVGSRSGDGGGKHELEER